MKPESTTPQTTDRGCLVVVLVMIAIIIFMIGLLVPVVFNTHDRALRSKTMSTLVSLCSAAKAYQRVYGKWPEPADNQDFVLTFSGLLDPRTGRRVTNNQAAKDNPLAIEFMGFKVRDTTIPGFGDRCPLAYYDLWGMPYAYCFDNGKKGSYYLGPLENGTPSNQQS